MGSISLADAKSGLSAVIDRVEAGETVCITRRGKPVAQISPLEKPLKRIDVEALSRHAANMPYEAEDSGTFIRRMRDEARY